MYRFMDLALENDLLPYTQFTDIVLINRALQLWRNLDKYCTCEVEKREGDRDKEWEENKMRENKKNAKDRFNKSWYANINQPKGEAHPYWIEKVNPCLLIMIKMLVVFISEIACRPRSFSLISDWNTWYRVWFYMI